MPIEIPSGPPPLPWEEYNVPLFKPGEAANFFPLEGRMRIDFTTPIGGWTNVSYGLFFQLPKWGYVRFRIKEATFVSPVFREYYELTVRQREQIEAQIKQGLASVTTAITDMELVYHDIRKYQDYLEYMTWIEKGKRMIKEGKKEEGEKIQKKGEQTIKAIFIDEVDVHTGELIALKSIAPRWPTIIADFMQLSDDETDPKLISKKHEISEAEAVVLATKNKLYLQWRDKIFFDTVKRRYKNLMMVLEARKKSVKEYRNMLRPVMARYKMLNDALSNKDTRTEIQRSWLHPEAQAQSADWFTIWAWRPFRPHEKYKASSESIDRITPHEAGFTKAEVEELKAAAKEKEIIFKGEVDALPMEPSIDGVVRRFIPAVEKEWGVKLSIVDVFKARQLLVNQFKETNVGLGGREPWVWSPYFVFIEIPMFRTVLRVPNGEEIEDVQIENIAAATTSQNLIIIYLLELVAKEKELDNYISEMLGESGIIEDEKEGERLVPIEEIIKGEYPEIFIKKEDEYKKFMEKVEKRKEDAKKIASATKFHIGDALAKIGWDVDFLRSRGPYEFAVWQRITKFYQTVTGPEFWRVVNYLKAKNGVPGYEGVPW